MSNAAAYRKRLLIRKLWLLDNAVESLSALYTKAPELNDEANIARIIPMSLNEWGDQIQKTIAWLESDNHWLGQDYDYAKEPKRY